MKPLVLYGTAKNWNDIPRLAFQIIDPVYKIPMVWEVVSASFRDGNFRRSYLRHLRLQGDKIPQLFEGMNGTVGIERLWVGPTFVVVFGVHDKFPAISTRVQEVMTKVLGEFDFEDVGENNMELGLIGVAMEREVLLREQA